LLEIHYEEDESLMFVGAAHVKDTRVVSIPNAVRTTTSAVIYPVKQSHQITRFGLSDKNGKQLGAERHAAFDGLWSTAACSHVLEAQASQAHVPALSYRVIMAILPLFHIAKPA
jgi:hypothetical protein